MSGGPHPPGDCGKWVLFYVLAALFLYTVLAFGVALAVVIG